MTVDIAALRREAASIIGLLTAAGSESFTLDKTADFFDDVFTQLEAERQRADKVDKWAKCVEAERDKNIAWHSKQLNRANSLAVELEAAHARIAELESKQEPVPIYQYEHSIYNENNGDTEWFWADCDKGFYEQYSPECRRILYTDTPKPAIKLPEPELVYSTATDSYGEEGCKMLAVADVLRILNQHGITFESE